MQIILASSSPRRKELLNKLRLTYKVLKADINEEYLAEEDPRKYVQRMSIGKAKAGAEALKEGLIIGADTIVTIDNKILGKPKDIADAKDMLRLLSGREHVVITSITLHEVLQNRKLTAFEETKVVFQKLSLSVIDNYLKTKEYSDKAGAYGIQGLGSLLVKEIHGTYDNVVGLPLGLLYEMLKEFDIEII